MLNIPILLDSCDSVKIDHLPAKTRNVIKISYAPIQTDLGYLKSVECIEALLISDLTSYSPVPGLAVPYRDLMRRRFLPGEYSCLG